MTRLSLSLALLGLALPAAVAAAGEPVLPVFDLAAFAEPKANPWFPLEPGATKLHREAGAGAEAESSTTAVHGPGPTILGVATVAVLDEAFEADRLVERTLDYYATDQDGNVWYFGEDVTNFRYDEAGTLIGTDSKSAWLAGVDGAMPGILLSGAPVPGLTLFQEHAPQAEATDYAEVVATGLALTVAAGSFTDVVQTFEASTSEPDLREFKYYAPGIGLIRAEEELSPERSDPERVIELQP